MVHQTSQPHNSPRSRFCPNCGAGLESRSVVCITCGASTSSSDSSRSSRARTRGGTHPLEGKVRRLRKLALAALVISFVTGSAGITLAQLARVPLECSKKSAPEIARSLIDDDKWVIQKATCLPNKNSDQSSSSALGIILAPKPSSAQRSVDPNARLQSTLWQLNEVVTGESRWDPRPLAKVHTQDSVLKLESADDPFTGDIVEWTRVTKANQLALDANSADFEIGYRRLSLVDRKLKTVSMEILCSQTIRERTVGPDNWTEQFKDLGMCADVTDDGIVDVLASPDDDKQPRKVRVFQRNIDPYSFMKRRASHAVWVEASTPSSRAPIIATGPRPGAPRSKISYFRWITTQVRPVPRPLLRKEFAPIGRCQQAMSLRALILDTYDVTCQEARMVVNVHDQSNTVLTPKRQPRITAAGSVWECTTTWRDSATDRKGVTCRTPSQTEGDRSRFIAYSLTPVRAAK